MASEDKPYNALKNTTTADKVADAVLLTESTIKDAILHLIKETGLCIYEIDISYLIKSSAFGLEITNVGIFTKIKLVKEM